MTRFVSVQYAAPACTITFNRDEKCNAFCAAMSEEVIDAIDKAVTAQCKAVVLTANKGVNVWSSGHDLSEIYEVEDLVHDEMFLLFEKIAACPLPVVCAIDGDVYAGGFLITLISDIVIATARSRFCMPINKMGIPLPGYFYKVAIDKLGARKAQEMFLCADFISAADAYSNGLLNHVVPDPVELQAQVTRVLRGIAACLPESLAYTKSVFNILTQQTGLNAQQESALSRRFEGLAGSPEIAERVKAIAAGGKAVKRAYR